MTDDLDDIKAMMAEATPRPDPGRRAENLTLAEKNFDMLQGSRGGPRLTPATGQKGLLSGVRHMLDSLTTKGGLTATTALVACGFLFMTPTGQDLWQQAPAAKSTEIGPDSTVAQTRTETAADDTSVEARDSEEAGGLAPEVMEAPVDNIVANPNSPPPPAITLNEQTEGGFHDLGNANATAILSLESAPLDLAAEAHSRSQFAPSTLVAPAPAADYPILQQETNTEAFPDAAPNPLKITQDSPVSTFSIDVDTAAYSVVRSSLMAGQVPPKEAVRIEEMINYFPYDYPAPDADDGPFRPTVSSMTTPWNPDTQLVHIALQGQLPAIETRPPLNLVFLIDTSGSMDQPNKLPLLKQSLMLMLDQLRPEDEVAIVAYAGSAGEVLAPTPASEKGMILAALARLGAGGGTNGQSGLEQAYAIADQMAEDGEVSRVLLATDGDFNIGIHEPDALKDFISDKRDTGTYLSVLGFGRGNLDDATMQALAQNGNGTAAYIDTLSEAQKVLVDQLTGALFTIAGDVKIQVEWNPAEVAEYRLIGYETRALNREDFNNDKVDAGELGAGHSVTAVYEITPVGSPAQLSEPLRYAAENTVATTGELGFLKLRYKAPGENVSELIETPIRHGSEAGSDARFAAAIAGFGQLLRDDTYLGDWSFDDAIALANANRGEDAFGYRSEAVQLMRLAESLSQ